MGGPVAGTDADGDALTYQLGGPDATEPSLGFNIDRTTGQITTIAAALNYEAPADTGETDNDNAYEVEVTAFDSSGAPSTPVTVTITVMDVNDAPVFTAGPAGMALDHIEDAEDLIIGAD